MILTLIHYYRRAEAFLAELSKFVEDRESTGFSFAVRDFLRTIALISLTLLHSRDHRTLILYSSDHRVGFQVLFIYHWFALWLPSIMREEKGKFSRFLVILNLQWRQTSTWTSSATRLQQSRAFLWDLFTWTSRFLTWILARPVKLYESKLGLNTKELSIE